MVVVEGELMRRMTKDLNAFIGIIQVAHSSLPEGEGTVLLENQSLLIRNKQR